jgi:hypothetical protein
MNLTPTENKNLRINVNERDEKVELGFQNIPADQVITILLEDNESVELMEALNTIVVPVDQAAFYGNLFTLVLNESAETTALLNTLQAVFDADSDTLNAINATLAIE